MKAKGDYQYQVHLAQMVLKIVRPGDWTGLREQCPKANQGGLLGLSPLRSEGSWVVRRGRLDCVID